MDQIRHFYIDFNKKDIREKSMAKGRLEGEAKIILNMLKKNMDINVIMECTDLSEKEIHQIQAKMA